MNEDTLISEDDFDNVWGATTMPNGELWSVGALQSIPANRIWTVYENGSIDEDGNSNNDWYATPGIVHSIALGILVTQMPWDERTRDAIWHHDTDEFARDERRALHTQMIT